MQRGWTSIGLNKIQVYRKCIREIETNGNNKVCGKRGDGEENNGGGSRR